MAAAADGRADAVRALDAILTDARRAFTHPPLLEVMTLRLGRHVDFSKLLACQKVADLTDAGEAVTVKDVAASLHLEPSTTSRLLGDTEADGLIVRGTDPTDRRRTTIALTESGRDVVTHLEAARLELLGAVLQDFSVDDVRTLARLMEQFVLGLQALATPGQRTPPQT